MTNKQKMLEKIIKPITYTRLFYCAECFFLKKEVMYLFFILYNSKNILYTVMVGWGQEAQSSLRKWVRNTQTNLVFFFRYCELSFLDRKWNHDKYKNMIPREESIVEVQLFFKKKFLDVDRFRMYALGSSGWDC